MRKISLLLASVVLAVLLASGAAGALTPGAVLDANAPNHDSYGWYTASIPPSDQRIVQTFVAQNTGYLTDIKVRVQLNTEYSGEMIAQIISISTPNGPTEVLSETRVGAPIRNSTSRMMSATFASPAYVVAGQTYGLALDTLPEQGGGWIVSSAGYPDGKLRGLQGNSTWTDFSDSIDGVFSIYVVPATTPPQLDLPADITEEATGPNGAAVNYSAMATDDMDGNVPVNCSPTSGSIFSITTTQVNCSATDSTGNRAEGSFNVTVQDTTTPTISGVPADITKAASSSSGATVRYDSPTASDLVDGLVPVNCLPASGSTFTLGTTTVNCSASDSRNNTAQKSFNVNTIYSWDGVLQPIKGGSTLNDYADDTSTFRHGGAVPVTFKLSGESAGITDATARLSVAKVANNVAGSEADASSTAVSTTGNHFRYDATNDQYVFNWDTKGLEAGTYQLRIDLGDGTTNTVRVSLR